MLGRLASLIEREPRRFGFLLELGNGRRVSRPKTLPATQADRAETLLAVANAPGAGCAIATTLIDP